MKKLWKNWKTINKGNYKYALVPEHPHSTKNGYVLEHRVVIENKIGRLLEKNEVVHHIDGNRINNKEINLQLMKRDEHAKLHSKKVEKIKLKCRVCKNEFEIKPNNYRFKKSQGQKGFCCSRRCNGSWSRNKGWRRKKIRTCSSVRI